MLASRTSCSVGGSVSMATILVSFPAFLSASAALGPPAVSKAPIPFGLECFCRASRIRALARPGSPAPSKISTVLRWGYCLGVTQERLPAIRQTASSPHSAFCSLLLVCCGQEPAGRKLGNILKFHGAQAAPTRSRRWLFTRRKTCVAGSGFSR